MTHRGHTRIAPAALRHTLEAVAAGAFTVPRDDVSAALRDDAGKLGAELQVRLPAPSLLAAAREAKEHHSTFEQANIARLRIAFAGRRITGMEMGRINIRLAAAPRTAAAARTDRARTVQRPADQGPADQARTQAEAQAKALPQAQAKALPQAQAEAQAKAQDGRKP